jgi:hypothetical protein
MTTASVCSFSPAMATTIEVAKAADAAGLYAVWTGEFNDRSHWGAKQSGLIATRLLNPAAEARRLSRHLVAASGTVSRSTSTFFLVLSTLSDRKTPDQ